MMAAVTLTMLFAFLSLVSSASCRTMVGEITAINDVKANKEVQELGKFAVDKYNQGLKLWKNVDFDGEEHNYTTKNCFKKIEFMEVVEANQQVVAGTKYYMKILATENGVEKMFTCVVVVKPWLHSKQLLNFALYSSSSSSSSK